MNRLFYISIIGLLISCSSNEIADSRNEKEEVPSKNRPSVKTDWAQFDLKGKVKSLHVSYYLVALENDSFVIGEKIDAEENYYYFDSLGYIQDHFILKGKDTIGHSKYKHDAFGNILEIEMKNWVYHSVIKYVSTFMKDKNLITEMKYYKNDSLNEITSTTWDIISGGWLRRDSKKDVIGNTISEWEIEILEDGKGNVTEKKEKLKGQTVKHVKSEYDSESRLIRHTTLAGMATVEYLYQFDSLGLNTEIILTDSNGANKQITKITYEFGTDSLNWIQCFRNTDDKTGYFEKREIGYF